jgi:signal transduction histidine kinase/CHASE3 domain sensor protein/ActR/RegA family two-component response regulator
MITRLKKFESESFGTFGTFFIPPVAALVLLGALTLTSLENIKKSESTIARAHEANAVIKNFQLHLLNAETGQRGYLLSGDLSYLEPYYSAHELVKKELGEIRELAKVLEMGIDDKELIRLAQERFEQLNHTIKLQQDGKLDEVADFVASQVGQRTMNKIRDSAAKIESQLANKINESNRNARNVHFMAWAAAAFALPLALVAIVWSLMRANAELKRRKEGELIIQRHAIQLRSMAEIIARIVATKDVDSVVGIALNEFRQLIGAREALVQLHENGETQMIRGIVGTDAKQPPQDYLACVFQLINHLSRGEASFHRHHSEFENVESIKAIPAWAVCGHAMDDILSAPLRDDRGNEIGRIVLIGKNEDKFNSNDVMIAAQLAFTVSVALQNARLTALAHREAERKDEFLAMLGHELRNPLAGILTGSEALLATNTDPMARPLFESIHRQSELMSHVVDDLLDVSRIGQGKILLNKARLDLTQLLDQLIKDHSLLTPNRTINLTLPKKPIIVYADRLRITQCITNLLQNALKFSETDKPVDVSLSLSGDNSQQATIFVRDYGVGLESTEIAEIFHLFHQSRVSLDRTHSGLGIGLTVARGLIEMHGGKIEVTSDGLGHGATFSISLPVVEDSSVKDASPFNSNASTSNTSTYSGKPVSKVLVIDDRLDVILPIRVVLKREGYAFEEAYTGQEGLAKAREFKPDFILCDIGLPGDMSGFDVAKAIRNDEQLSHVYLVALTGYSQPLDQMQSLNAGFDYHVAKPIELKLLHELIDKRPKFSMSNSIG